MGADKVEENDDGLTWRTSKCGLSDGPHQIAAIHRQQVHRVFGLVGLNVNAVEQLGKLSRIKGYRGTKAPGSVCRCVPATRSSPREYLVMLAHVGTSQRGSSD